ncbi:MAG: glycosyltransferase family 39 protein, partial [Acidobacteriota bacterium]|nr:glycosyltransferase family 39 protein [Acidobacteriota bacterium]
MPTAEGHARPGRRIAWLTLAGLLAGALALRLWGVGHGLPYAYNIDEADQFVPRAIGMTGLHLNPHYFANPPALTYLLHLLFMFRYGGHAAAVKAFREHPSEVYTLARAAVAVLGVIALWLLYVLGARLFDRRTGLLATALGAVAFLPVFYSHLALNDVPMLVPLLACLIGAAGIVRTGHTREYVLAGIGLGLATATKYTAGIALVALGIAVGMRWRGAGGARRELRAPLEGLALAGVLAALAFLVANPYALLDSQRFLAELGHERSVASEAAGKLGAPHEPTIVYYLWSFTWGLGWLPALAALGGLFTAYRRARPAWLLLVPMSLLYLLYMSTQGRAFGRWLMPILPVACLLAAHFTLSASGLLARLAARRFARARRGLPALAGGGLSLALLAQGVVYGVHSDLVLARADTRSLARAWMVAHVPAGALVVLEPGVVEAAWPRVSPAPGAISTVPNLWNNYPFGHWLIAPAAQTGQAPGRGPWRFVHHYPREDQYARTLTPALIDYYRQHGYCWILSASTQSERVFADPRAVPLAAAYYRALARSAQVAYRVSPYAAGARPVRFSYDWSFDYYPLAYRRAGPVVT